MRLTINSMYLLLHLLHGKKRDLEKVSLHTATAKILDKRCRMINNVIISIFSKLKIECNSV